MLVLKQRAEIQYYFSFLYSVKIPNTLVSKGTVCCLFNITTKTKTMQIKLGEHYPYSRLTPEYTL